MSFPVTFFGIEGLTGAYARIKRKDDGFWYDEAADTWIATATSDTDLALTEDGSEAGKYTATAATFNAKPGAKYITYVYTSADVLINYTENTYKSAQQKTALEIVQEVQRELRLPQASGAFSKAHDVLMLIFANKFIDLTFEAGQWEELDIAGGITLTQGKSVYVIEPANNTFLDVINHMQIGTNVPLKKFMTNDDFRNYAREQSSTQNQPLYMRIYGRQGRSILFEVAPTPDQSYLLDWEGQMKPLKLVNTTDICIFDSDLIIDGTLMLAKEESGLDFSAEADVVRLKTDSRVKSEADDSWGDIQAI